MFTFHLGDRNTCQDCYKLLEQKTFSVFFFSPLLIKFNCFEKIMFNFRYPLLCLDTNNVYAEQSPSLILLCFIAGGWLFPTRHLQACPQSLWSGSLGPVFGVTVRGLRWPFSSAEPSLPSGRWVLPVGEWHRGLQSAASGLRGDLPAGSTSPAPLGGLQHTGLFQL